MQSVSKATKYLYNGKEYQPDHGFNWYDYGLRFYDPAVCRFWSVDPLADKFPWWTTYQYAGNMPIKFIDLDGAEPFLPRDSWGEPQWGNNTWMIDDYYVYQGKYNYFYMPKDRSTDWKTFKPYTWKQIQNMSAETMGDFSTSMQQWLFKTAVYGAGGLAATGRGIVAELFNNSLTELLGNLTFAGSDKEALEGTDIFDITSGTFTALGIEKLGTYMFGQKFKVASKIVGEGVDAFAQSYFNYNTKDKWHTSNYKIFLNNCIYKTGGKALSNLPFENENIDPIIKLIFGYASGVGNNYSNDRTLKGYEY